MKLQYLVRNLHPIFLPRRGRGKESRRFLQLLWVVSLDLLSLFLLGGHSPLARSQTSTPARWKGQIQMPTQNKPALYPALTPGAALHFSLWKVGGFMRPKRERASVHNLQVLLLNRQNLTLRNFSSCRKIFHVHFFNLPGALINSHDPSLGKWAKCDISKIQFHIFLRLGCLMVSQ